MARRSANVALLVRPVDVNVAPSRIRVPFTQAVEPKDSRHDEVGTGLRPLNTVSSGAPSPIFSAIRNLPVGVL